MAQEDSSQTPNRGLRVSWRPPAARPVTSRLDDPDTRAPAFSVHLCCTSKNFSQRCVLVLLPTPTVYRSLIDWFSPVRASVFSSTRQYRHRHSFVGACSFRLHSLTLSHSACSFSYGRSTHPLHYLASIYQDCVHEIKFTNISSGQHRVWVKNNGL